MVYNKKMKIKFRNILILVILVLTYIILFLAPPLSGEYHFSFILLLCCLMAFFIGRLKKNYTLVGLIIPLGNALTKLSPVIYPTVSFISMSLFLGYLLNEKENEFEKSPLEIKNRNFFLFLGFCFFLVMFISGFIHVLKLLYPSIVYCVNIRGMTNYEIIYHIVGYVLAPLAAAFVLFYLILFESNDNIVESIFRFLALGIIISSIVGFLQFLEILKGRFGFIYNEKRVTGLFLDFNSFGLSLSLLLPVFAYKFFKNNKGYVKWLYLISSVFGFISLLLTGNRTAFVSIILFSFLVSLFFLYRNKNKVFALIIVLFLIIIFVFVPKIKTNIYSINRVFNVLNSRLAEQIKDRQVYWKVGLALFQKKPFIGNGIKSGYKEFYNFYPEGWGADFILNEYLQYLAEIGILGTIIFLIIIFIPTYILIKNLKDNLDFSIILAFIPFLFVLLFHVLELEEVTLLFWLYIAIIYSKNLKLFSEHTLKYFNVFLCLIVSLHFILSVVDLILEIPKIDVLKYKWYAGLYYDKKDKDKVKFFTDKYAIFRLDKLKGKKLNFEFNSAGIEDQEVKILINEKEFTLIKLDKNYEVWYPFSLEVTEEVKTLKIIPKKTFIPAGWFNRYFFPFNGKDYRQLGILLSYKDI